MKNPGLITNQVCADHYGFKSCDIDQLIKHARLILDTIDPLNPHQHPSHFANGIEANIYAIGDEWVLRRVRRKGVHPLEEWRNLQTHGLIQFLADGQNGELPIKLDSQLVEGSVLKVKPVEVLAAYAGIKEPFSIRKKVHGEKGTLQKDSIVSGALINTHGIGFCLHDVGNILYNEKEKEAYIIEGLVGNSSLVSSQLENLKDGLREKALKCWASYDALQLAQMGIINPRFKGSLDQLVPPLKSQGDRDLYRASMASNIKKVNNLKSLIK